MGGSTRAGATTARPAPATHTPAGETGAVVDLREASQSDPAYAAHAPHSGATHALGSGATHAPGFGPAWDPAAYALAARAPVGAAGPTAPNPGRASEIAASTDGERAHHGWVVPVLVAFVCLLVVASVVVAASRGWQARAEAELAPVHAAAQRTVSDAIRARYGAWPVPGQEGALPTEANAVSAEVWLSGPVPDGTIRSCEVRTGGSLTDVSILCADRNGRQVPW